MELSHLPNAVLSRLPLYLRFAKKQLSEGKKTVGSAFLAQSLALTPSQIRQDLSYLDCIGTKGTGYDTEKMCRSLENFLGLDRKLRAVLVGANELGLYAANVLFAETDTELLGVFDDEPKDFFDKEKVLPQKDRKAFCEENAPDFIFCAAYDKSENSKLPDIPVFYIGKTPPSQKDEGFDPLCAFAKLSYKIKINKEKEGI